MATAATAKGSGWPGSSGRACCTPFDVYGDEKLEDLSGSALSGALVPLEVECKLRQVSFRPDCERAVSAPSAECFPVQTTNLFKFEQIRVN